MAQRAMQIGVMPSIAENGVNGKTARYRAYQQMAQRAEQIGFDSFWLADHLIFRFPGEDETGAWEVFTFLSGIAATTERIQLGPLVACTSFRNPALLAKMADALDDMSDGRFILGLGAGWHQPEYDAFGYPFDRKASRFEEALTLIRDLLHGERVTREDGFYPVKDVVLRPRGPSRNGPPIWIGAKQPRMLELTARYADAYNFVWPTDPARVAETWERVRAACEKVGRDPATLTLTAGTLVRVLADGETPPEDADKMITGTPEQVAERLRGFAEVGVKHLILSYEPGDLEGIERLAPVLAALDRAG